MSHATLQSDIETRFMDAWKLRSNSRIALDNGAFVEWVTEIIDPGELDEQDLSSWRAVDPALQDLSSYVSLRIHELKSSTVTIGAPTKRRRTIGNIHIEVSVPRSVGTYAARQVADDVKSIFRDVMTTSGIEFFEGSVSPIGEKYYSNTGSTIPETSQKWILVVSVPFRYDVDI